jgi:hypothetical protein
MSWKDEFENRKREVGMSRPGSTDYVRAGVYVLDACPDRCDTREKMRAASSSTDRVTRAIARGWLGRHGY